MASESVPTLAMSNCSLGLDRPKLKPTLIPDELQASVLEEIFKHLRVLDLLQVRSTCRHWKKTVDGCPELMEKVSIKFPENLVYDRNYQPGALVPAKNASFTKSRISSVDSWWPSVGHRIVHLAVKDCQMSFSMLVKILRHTPELKSLDYLCSSYPAVVTNFGNLKLRKLENLAINVPNEKILDVVIELRKLFPNLKSLKVLKKLNIEDLVKSQNYLADILEEIHLNSIGTLEKLRQFNRLKYLVIHEIVTNEILCRIADTFPELRSIAVYVEHNIALKPTFLNKMKKLQNLTIQGEALTKIGFLQEIGYYPASAKIDFGECNSHHLRQICLKGIVPKPFTLQHYLKNSANVRVLTFNACRFESWTEIFTLAENLAFLEQLELNSINVNNQDYKLCEYFENLKFLNMRLCQLPETLLTTFFCLCPQLEEIYLECVEGVTDLVIKKMIESTTKLRKLTLSECAITDTAVECIANSDLLLKNVSIQCSQVSVSALDKLKSNKNK